MANKDRFQFVQSDEKVRLVVNCIDTDDTPINVAGASANLRWRLIDGTIVNKDMIIEDASGGIVSYTFQTDELVPPTMEYEVTITKGDGTIISSLTSEILGVRKRLSA